MTTEEMVARIKKLDRLYLAADQARLAFLENPCEITERRWTYYERKYRDYRDQWEEAA